MSTTIFDATQKLIFAGRVTCPACNGDPDFVTAFNEPRVCQVCYGEIRHPDTGKSTVSKAEAREWHAERAAERAADQAFEYRGDLDADEDYDYRLGAD